MSDRLEPYIHRILDADFTEEYHLGSILSTMSGKVSVVEATALAKILNDHSFDDPAIQDLSNRLLTYVKLKYSDEAKSFEKKIRFRAESDFRHEQEKEKLLRKLKEDLNRNVVSTSQYGSPIEKILAPVRLTPTMKFKDQLLTFMDKINSGSVDEIKEEENILIDELRVTFGVELEKKGWLAPTYRFIDKSLADLARAKIAKV